MTLKEEIVGLSYNDNLSTLVNCFVKDDKLYENNMDNYISLFGEKSRPFFYSVHELLIEGMEQNKPKMLTEFVLSVMMARMLAKMGLAKFNAWRARVAAAKGIIAKQQPMQPAPQQ